MRGYRLAPIIVIGVLVAAKSKISLLALKVVFENSILLLEACDTQLQQPHDQQHQRHGCLAVWKANSTHSKNPAQTYKECQKQYQRQKSRQRQQQGEQQPQGERRSSSSSTSKASSRRFTVGGVEQEPKIESRRSRSSISRAPQQQVGLHLAVMINLEGGFGPPLPLGEENGKTLSGKLTQDPSALSGGPLQDGVASGAFPANKGGEASGGGGPSAQSAGGLLLGPLGDLFPGSSHPGVCFFHILFKCLSLTTYCFGSLVFGGGRGDSDFVVTFVLTLVLLSLDFWTVKNISGRKLVGLCWQHRVAADGESEWVFQKAPADRRIGSVDYRVFWGGLVVWALVWVALCINTVVSLDLLWFLMASVGLVLSGTNLLAYYKCARCKQLLSTSLVRLLLLLLLSSGCCCYGPAIAFRSNFAGSLKQLGAAAAAVAASAQSPQDAATWRRVVLSRLGLA
ncbi:hypothetical protein Emag_003913 [Eimeria magna]